MKFYILLFVVMCSLAGCVDVSPEAVADAGKERYNAVLKNQELIDKAKARVGEWVVVDIFSTPNQASSPRAYVLEREQPFSRFSLRSIAFAKFGPSQLDGNSLLKGDRIRITPHAPSLEEYERIYKRFPDYYTYWDEFWGYHVSIELVRGEK